MILIIPIILILAVPVWLAFVASRNQRHEDWRYFAAFLGFSNSLVTVIATLLWAVAGLPSHASVSLQEFTFVIGIVGILSTLVACSAGIVSRGVQRLKLIGFTVVIAFVYLLGMFTHFAD
jgi:hypothetical protein